jgi:hypothetical protein
MSSCYIHNILPFLWPLKRQTDVHEDIVLTVTGPDKLALGMKLIPIRISASTLSIHFGRFLSCFRQMWG